MGQTKKLDKTGLSQVWSRIVANFVAKETGKGLSSNDFTDELKTLLENLSEAGGQANIIESVSVNGVALEVTDKNINILVPEGALAGLDKVDEDHLADSLKNIITGKANKATTLEGYGITDAYSKQETDDAISAAVSQAVTGVYLVKGSVAFADLPEAGLKPGFVYNITDDFVTTAGFVGGAGKKYPAGTNVVYTDTGWDAMAGVYDFSGFLMADSLVDITEAEIDEICKMPTL